MLVYFTMVHGSKHAHQDPLRQKDLLEVTVGRGRRKGCRADTYQGLASGDESGSVVPTHRARSCGRYLWPVNVNGEAAERAIGSVSDGVVRDVHHGRVRRQDVADVSRVRAARVYQREDVDVAGGVRHAAASIIADAAAAELKPT